MKQFPTLKPLDFIKWLARHPGYRKDYNVYAEKVQGGSLDGIEKADHWLLGRWPILKHPVDPDNAKERPGVCLSCLMSPVEIIRPYWVPGKAPSPAAAEVPRTILRPDRANAGKWGLGDETVAATDVIGGRFLPLMFDISKTWEEGLETLTSAYVDAARRVIGYRAKEKGLPKYFWDIYDAAMEKDTSSPARLIPFLRKRIERFKAGDGRNREYIRKALARAQEIGLPLPA